MTYFGLSNPVNPGQPTNLDVLLGMGTRKFSGFRNNAAFSAGIPSNLDQSHYNVGEFATYRNQNHQSKMWGTPSHPVTVPKGIDFGGVGTTFLFWGQLGDASDIHTPTGGDAECDAWWHARKIDIAQMVTAAGTPYRPFLLSFHHEQKVNNDTKQIGVGTPDPLTGLGGCGTAAEYQQAFRHFSALINDSYGPGQPGWPAGLATGNLRDLGVVKMCFVPVLAQFMSDPVFGFPKPFPDGYNTPPDTNPPSKVTACDPGSAYWDLTGIDWYPNCNDSQPWGNITPSITNQLIFFDAVHQYSLDRGKQWIIGEWGAFGGSTTQAIADRVASLITAMGPHFETYGTGPGSVFAWLTSADVMSASDTSATDDVIHRATRQAVQTNIVNRPYYVFVGDSAPPPPPTQGLAFGVNL